MHYLDQINHTSQASSDQYICRFCFAWFRNVNNSLHFADAISKHHFWMKGIVCWSVFLGAILKNSQICFRLWLGADHAEIDIETVCPLKTPTFPPGTHEYEPKRHSLIEGVSKCIPALDQIMACHRQVIIWTNDDIVYWQIYALLDRNKLNQCFRKTSFYVVLKI